MANPRVGCALVHSPLVGPSSWSLVAEELSRVGWDVVVPTLTEAARSERGPEGCADTVVRALSRTHETRVVVAHSGAGRLLPLIADGVEPRPEQLVFVDAIVPPETGTSFPTKEFVQHLRSLASDGFLPPWSEWFGTGVVEELVPDPRMRKRFVSELPKLPLRFLEQPVPVPDGWATSRCSYILLSEAYREYAVVAQERGWTVVELLGTHLDIVTKPVEIAEAIVCVTDSGN